MKDPSLSVDQVLLDWAEKRYPYAPGSGYYISSALKRTQYINHNGRYHLEFWLTKSIGEQWDDYRYYFGHLLQRSRYKWTLDPADKETEQKLYYPDMQIYRKLVEEKEEVLAQVRLSIEDINLAGKYLNPQDKNELLKEFDFLLDASQLQLEWVKAYFAQRLYMKDPKNEYRIMAENALRRLQELESFQGINYGLDPQTGRRYFIDLFILEMEWRMANRSRAIREDNQILIEVEQKINVDVN